MRSLLLNSISSQSFDWIIKTNFKKTIEKFKDYFNRPKPLFLMPVENFHYQNYQSWSNTFLRQLKLLQNILLHFDIDPNVLDTVLGTHWTSLPQEQVGLSLYAYQQGLEFLERQSNHPLLFQYKLVVHYHKKCIQEYLKKKLDIIDYFYRDLINYLIEYASNRTAFSTIEKLLRFYQPAASTLFFNTVEKAVKTVLLEIEQNSNDNNLYYFSKIIPISQLVTSLHALFKEELLLSPSQNILSAESTSPVLSSKKQRNRMSTLNWGLSLLGLAVQASAAAAQNSFLINNAVSGAQAAPSVDAFPSGGFVTAWESASQQNSSNIVARVFDNNGMPMDMEFPLSANNNDRRPNVGAFSDGTFVTVWERLVSGMNGTIFARRANSMAPIGIEFPLTNSTGDQRRPVVLTFPNGAFTAQWDHLESGLGWSVRSRRFDSNNNPVGIEQVVSSIASSNPRNPAIAKTFANEIVSVWERNEPQEADYTGSTTFGLMTAGGGVSAAFDGNTNQPATSCSTLTYNVAFVGRQWPSPRSISGTATWGSNDNGYAGGTTPAFSLRLFGGSFVPTVWNEGDLLTLFVNVIPDVNNANPKQVFGIDSPKYNVSWVVVAHNGGPTQDAYLAEVKFYQTVYNIISSISFNGVEVIPSSQISSSLQDIQGHPSVATFLEGGHATTWNRQRQDDSGNDIYFQLANSGGNPIAPPILVNTETQKDHYNPFVATLQGSKSAVVWEVHDSFSSDVYGQFVNEASNPVGNEFLINSEYANGNQTNPKVTRLSNNNLVTVWSGEGTTDVNGIYGKVIDTHLYASATNQIVNYQENTNVNLSNIVITPPLAITNVTISLTLSNLNAGLLTVDTSGTVTSVFNPNSGIWQATGPVSDVNTLLGMLQFRPYLGYNNNFTIAVDIQDGLNQLQDLIQVIQVPILTTSLSGTSGPVTTSISSATGASTSTAIGTTTNEVIAENIGSSSSHDSDNLIWLWILITGVASSLATAVIILTAQWFYRKNRSGDQNVESNDSALELSNPQENSEESQSDDGYQNVDAVNNKINKDKTKEKSNYHNHVVLLQQEGVFAKKEKKGKHSSNSKETKIDKEIYNDVTPVIENIKNENQYNNVNAVMKNM